MNEPSGDITELLERWSSGDRSVEARIVEQLYPMLRRLAGSQLRDVDGTPTLSATALANEAFIRLQAQRVVDWQNRDHFFAIAASLLRRVVIDYLRARGAEKRGADAVVLALQDAREVDLPRQGDHTDWLALDQALNRLSLLDPDCARVIELRVFAGLTIDAVAALTGVSVPTVVRQWRFARSWLAEQMELDSEG
ncbi:ECF-type sigma factor [Aquimonas voraii]|uniref:ECF-type sigma factor n=1 Tax=Aquimonas voraii TaxID=265719 RepID=UPI0015A41839|nr:ECF-type sigma factor [Aquimonas voraii]